jgi:uncharacterized protein YecE (DUF72 family)
VQSRKLNIGTSGWNYKHWRGKFYPQKLKQSEWLEYISRFINTVEINNSFYRLPTKTNFQNWKNNSPGNFLFAVKASRYITHVKKMIDPEEPVKNIVENSSALGKKLGPILFQFPPSWKINLERFEYFLNTLPKRKKFTFEFRNNTWWNDDILNLLKKKNHSFCIWELAGEITPKIVTADWIYIRLHGPGKNKYQGKYDDKTLYQWADDFNSWLNSGIKKIYCYFDNDDSAFAIENAIRLNEITEEILT